MLLNSDWSINSHHGLDAVCLLNVGTISFITHCRSMTYIVRFSLVGRFVVLDHDGDRKP